MLQALLAGDYQGAEQRAARLQDIFGQGNLFVELQDHGIADQHRTNPQLVEIARRIGAPLLATNDSHYTHREDAVAHDALLCVQTGALLSDTNRFKFEGTEHYLKSAAEMRHLFREVPEACDNTLLIAERADVQIELGKPSLPEFPVPDRFTGATYEERAQAYLKHLAFEGARERYGDPMPPEVLERLEFELNVIGDMGFPAYFLVVWDLIRFARESGIRVGPGRGSAAGCCVAYCLRIVDLDPIRYDLLFERFLNPGRKQMPDIDMDFDERYRADVMRYAAEKYGSDRVAQIITFSTIKARAAVRDASRVLGKPYIVGDKIAKAMPPLIMGRDTPLRACLEKIEGYEDGYATAGDLRAMHDTDPEAKEVIDVALGLEGLRRQDGIHAAAVVISHDPLTDYLPIQRKPESGGVPEDAPIVTQYEMHGVEELGLLKMDFLGLRNLSIIERALDLIEAETGERPDIDNLDLADEPTLEMLRRAESIGVFQLEGAAMRQTLRALAPTSFDDVAALVALYRPGPMAANMHRDYPELKNGRKELTYLHPDIEPILKDTYGLMLYQESVMRVAQRFAGYSLEEADNLRKACGKKIRALIAAEREKFVAGCVSEGYGEELGTQLFDIIEPFADYAFNKSHSYGYGLVAYQTAWLKAHYPVEYMSALLTSVKDNKDKTAVYLAECRNMGIEVLVPDVNRSVAEVRSGPVHARCRCGRRCRGGWQRRCTGRHRQGGRRRHRFRPPRRRPRHAGPSSSAWPPCATWARAWSSGSWPSARRAGPSRTSSTSVPGWTRSCSTSGPWSRSSRGARSIRSAMPARACAWSSRPSSIGRSNVARSRTSASPRSSPPWRGRNPTRAGAGRRSPSPRRNSTRVSGSLSRRRCSASTSATTRSWGSRRPCPATPTRLWRTCVRRIPLPATGRRCGRSGAWSPI